MLWNYLCGKFGVNTRCVNRSELAGWLRGFAERCRDARSSSSTP